MSRSTGNVFRDLGFSADETESLRVRGDLLLNLQQTIAARKLKPEETAALLGVSQPRVSELLRGRVDLFSTGTLIDMLAKLGVRTKLVLQFPRRRAGAA
jgi:predicted XRE-type DNA-binding protein